MSANDDTTKVRPEDAGHKNPPLRHLNDNYREHDTERRADLSDTVRIVTSSLQQALTPSGKRTQKPLTAPTQPAAR